jgi:nitrate/TMAO reductase-like tetraheme cytochrome c subunit
MTLLSNFSRNWLRPILFFGNNPISLIGGAITSASAMILVAFWVVAVLGHGGSNNPYLGIIFDLCLPAIFICGLALIPVGIWLRHRHLKALDRLPSTYPKIDFADPVLRHGIDFVIIATFINFIIVGTASYRGVAYMDTTSFCGQTCHVMKPEFSAYHFAPHAGVACTECHVAPGVPGYVHAKVNGTMQLLMVVLHNYPRPIMADGKVPAARDTCVRCHNPQRLSTDKLLVTSSYGDDEKNSVTRSLVVMHIGGRDQFGSLSGIHGAHMGHIEYVSTDATNQTIPWVSKKNEDGSVTEFSAADSKILSTGQRHVMDCIDCHNRAAHSFDTPEEALNQDMALGSPSVSLPFAHKEGLALIKASYTSEEEARGKIASGFEGFYRSQYPLIWDSQRKQIVLGARTLADIYGRNVFPFMRVGWGTHPNNLGHNDSPGCFRCHDGNHNTKAGKSITNDCSMCHNLLVVDEPNPKLLTELSMQ